MSDTTIFQKIINREIPADIIYEDDDIFAFLDAFPLDKGHVLVIPKHPYVHIWDMPEQTYLKLQSVVQKIATQMHNQLNRDVAIIQRNGPEAGQEVMHLHVHLVPRYENEQTSPLFNYALADKDRYDSQEEKQSFVDLLSIR